jgi:hypothetical protein
MTGRTALPAGDPLRLVLLAIGVVTVVTGACQMVAPGWVLGLLSADTVAPLARHLFATVGMFMIVVGGLLVRALLSPDPPPYVLWWVGLQKFGAFAMVGLAVVRDLLSTLALLVAAFDLLTCFLCLVDGRRLAADRRRGTVHGGDAP